MENTSDSPSVTLAREAYQYCFQYYNNGWCDLVIETMSLDEIAKVIDDAQAKTIKAAIRALRDDWKGYAELRDSVRSEIF